MLEFAAVFGLGLLAGYAVGSSASDNAPDSVQALLEEHRETVRDDYQAGRISHARFAAEVELLEDPATEDVMYAVTDVDGIGPHTALEIAREYRSPDALAAADRADLEAVNGIGENRARAIRSRTAE
jgi:ERCC4-type nuclease